MGFCTTTWRAGLAAAMIAIALPLAARAEPLTTREAQTVDASVAEWLAQTHAPSVSIAVVREGEIAYAKAYGDARLAPRRPATADTRYAIDSISKEFCAAAILLLQQEGKLSLDDHVAKYFPALAGADKVTIRQILSHTAGYRDFWPQDFVPPEMARPVTLAALMDEWAKKPLDFTPGTDWQYSNTGLVIAGAIVQKVSGQPLTAFLQARIFSALRMARVTEDDTAPLPATDAGAYTRYGLGPVRPATKEGAGWLFGAAELAMTPKDLALWDISLINRSLLSPASYEALYTPVKLANGKDTHYSLGLDVEDDHGRRRVGHDGGGSGFLSSNRVWLDQKTAVIAFTNSDWASPDTVVDRVAFAVLKPAPAEARARGVFAGLQRGAVGRSLFTANGNAYLTPAALADHRAGLGPLGPPRQFTLRGESMRGGLRTRVWKITTAGGKTATAVERAYPEGKIEQFMVTLED